MVRRIPDSGQIHIKSPSPDVACSLFRRSVAGCCLFVRSCISGLCNSELRDSLALWNFSSLDIHRKLNVGTRVRNSICRRDFRDSSSTWIPLHGNGATAFFISRRDLRQNMRRRLESLSLASTTFRWIRCIMFKIGVRSQAPVPRGSGVRISR